MFLLPPLDLDGDGFLDLVDRVAGHRLANGRGAYGPMTRLPKPQGTAGTAMFGDVDGDGDIDIYITLGSFFEPAGDELWLQDHNHNFVNVSTTHIPRILYNSSTGVLFDADGDGDLDVAFGGFRSLLNLAQDGIFLNDGTGHFYEDLNQASMPSDNEDTVAMTSVDIDLDGDLDLIMGNSHPGMQLRSKVYLNDGQGRFSVGSQFPAGTPPLPWVADIDGDGDPDVGMFMVGGGIWLAPRLYENDGHGNLADVTRRLPSATPDYWGPDFGDVDEDGDVDIVVASHPQQIGPDTWRVVHQWINDGTGHFIDVTAATMPEFGGNAWGPYSVSHQHLADLDSDGDLDIIVTGGGGIFNPPHNNEIYWNLTRQVYAPSPARPGATYTVDFYARPGHGILPAASLAPARIPLGDLGILGLDPALLISGPGLLIGPSGKASITLTVPNDPKLVGHRLYWQAIDFATTPPYRMRLTNTFEEEIVR